MVLNNSHNPPWVRLSDAMAKHHLDLSIRSIKQPTNVVRFPVSLFLVLVENRWTNSQLEFLIFPFVPCFLVRPFFRCFCLAKLEGPKFQVRWFRLVNNNHQLLGGWAPRWFPFFWWKIGSQNGKIGIQFPSCTKGSSCSVFRGEFCGSIHDLGSADHDEHS